MLSRYIEDVKYTEFITYHNVVGVSIDGSIYLKDRVTEKPIDYEERVNANGESEIKLKMIDGEYWCSKSSMMAFAYKGKIGSARVIFARKVLYKDGDNKNIHPSNLIWSNTPPIETSGGFRMIPGFSRYYINRKGIVYNNQLNRFQSIYDSSLGYPMYGLMPDVGNRTQVGVHRLLGLAWLPYSADVDDLDINHVDGDKSNYPLDNLEWVTRSGNCIHAYRTGLRLDNKTVLVKNILTNEVTTYYSLAECSRQLGISHAQVCNRSRTEGNQVFEDGNMFKYGSSVLPWKTIHDPVAEIMAATKNVRLKVIGPNGEAAEYEMAKDAAEHLSITNKQLSKLISGKDSIIINGHTVERLLSKVLLARKGQEVKHLIAGKD